MARIILFGATGSLGRHMLRQALAGSHQVTAFVRSLPLDHNAGPIKPCANPGRRHAI